MAFSLLFEDVHGELLGHWVGSLGPLDQLAEKLLVLILEHEQLGDEISLPFEQQHWLLEVERLHDGLEHLLVVSWVHSLGVIQEVLLEENARDLSNLSLLTGHVTDEKLKQSAWISSTLAVELRLSSLSGGVISAENVL
jgi:hypothetical protein